MGNKPGKLNTNAAQLPKHDAKEGAHAEALCSIAVHRAGMRVDIHMMQVTSASISGGQRSLVFCLLILAALPTGQTAYLLHQAWAWMTAEKGGVFCTLF